VFELTPEADGKWTETVLINFGGKNGGQYPEASLTRDPAGHLYGTTTGGGTYRSGTVWGPGLSYSFNRN
jgi:hypothetical protein